MSTRKLRLVHGGALLALAALFAAWFRYLSASIRYSRELQTEPWHFTLDDLFDKYER